MLLIITITLFLTQQDGPRERNNLHLYNMVMYEQTMHLATLKEEQETVTFGFNAIQQSLLRHKTRTRTQLVDQSGILASLPVLEIQPY